MLKTNIKPLIIWFTLVCFACLSACSQEKSSKILHESLGYHFSYKLDEPVKTWKLPASLLEISGLGYIDEKRLACVQDEKGIIFIINSQTGKIDKEIMFGASGDYEGIEITGHDAWILRSDGTLFEVLDFLNKANPAVKDHPTALSIMSDAEGLAFDPSNNGLLIACKEQPFIDRTDDLGFKAVYRYDIKSGLLDQKPFLLINPDTLRHYRSHENKGHLTGDQTGSASSLKKMTFKPSGIAIHPVSGDIYILASVGKLLLVISNPGKIQAMVKLNPVIFPKPEGICFSPEGVLFISSEGGKQEATIMKFAPVE